MVRYCGICKVEYDRNQDVSIHNLPKSEDVKVKWFVNIGRKVDKCYGVYSKHFEEKDFRYKAVGDTVKRFLISGAVSTLLLPSSNRENILINSIKLTSSPKQTLLSSKTSDETSVLHSHQIQANRYSRDYFYYFYYTDRGNCILQDDTSVWKLNNISTKTEIPDEELLSISFEHNYVGSNRWSWSEYSHEIVPYIAGSIVRSITKSIKCVLCLEQLEDDSISSKLITLKNRVTKNNEAANSRSRRGLMSPSNDVITICKSAEKVLRRTPNLFYTKNLLGKLMIHAKKLLLPLNIFLKIDMCLEKSVFNNHKLDLINQILNRFQNPSSS